MKTEMAFEIHKIVQSDSVDARLHSLAGRRAWIISDSIAGHLAITSGIAERLELNSKIKPVSPRGFWRHLAPNGPADPKVMRALMNDALPEIALGAGRQTVPFMRALKRAGVFTVIFQAPRVWGESADLIWVPAHDRLSGTNIITTLTPPHRFTADKLDTLRCTLPGEITVLPQPRVTLLLGGPGAGYRYDDEIIRHFTELLEKSCQWAGSFLITPSRRTPNALLQAADKATCHMPRILWDGKGDNLYPNFLAAGDAFIVTADSVNMTGEACATGRPVRIFYPKGGRVKFKLFHSALQDHGATRPLHDTAEFYEPWSYKPLIATDIIATEIQKRWIRHHQERFSKER